MKIKIMILVMLFIIPGLAQDKVGTTAAPFLGIGAGPKAIGMGGAFTAVANDPSALYWNPAGISRTGKTEILFEHTNYLINTGYNFFGAVIAFDEDNAIGISITNLDYGTEDVTTVNSPDGTGEKWSAADWAVGITYSRNLTDRFSIAGTGKMVMQKIWRESATGWALDAGLLYITPFNDLKIAMDISNFGTDMQLSGEDLLVTYDPNQSMAGNNKKIPAQYYTNSYPMPLFFRIGLAMDVINSEDNRLTLAADAIHPSDNAENLNVGGEYAWNKLVFLRIGYKGLGIPDNQEGLTLGMGLSYQISYNLTFGLDYAYEHYGLLKDIQKIAVKVTF